MPMPPHITPHQATTTAWVAPGHAYAAWVILTAAGHDMSSTTITETPLMAGSTGIMVTSTPEAT